MTRSIAELRDAGVVFTAEEAVAITQQLTAMLRDPHAGDLVQPPFGPPSADNVFLGDDGSVVCRGCRATPAVSEIGIFLESLLPAGSMRVPGALRYTIARALLNVDVPPFDSLDDLSRDLARHERGSRVDWICGVLARASGRQPAATTLVLVDRRRARPSESELRRALREADARLFEQLSPVIVQQIDVQPAQPRSMGAVAACLAAGVALMVAGEFMHHGRPPLDATQTMPPVVEPARPLQEPVEPAPRPEPIARVEPSAAADPERGAADPARGIIAVRDVPSPPARVRRTEPRRAPAKRSALRPAAVTTNPQATRRHLSGVEGEPGRGVLDRLRLGWLRGALAVRFEP
jgi:hypothetical protein